MPSLPAGIPGWTVFAAGLAIVALRVHGIDSPRAWIEWTERQFVDRRRLQFLGAIACAAALWLLYLAQPPAGLIGSLYLLSVTFLALGGIGMIFGQNQLRMMLVATAEAEDKTIRITSIAIVLIGLFVALAPWFL